MKSITIYALQDRIKKLMEFQTELNKLEPFPHKESSRTLKRTVNLFKVMERMLGITDRRMSKDMEVWLEMVNVIDELNEAPQSQMEKEEKFNNKFIRFVKSIIKKK